MADVHHDVSSELCRLVAPPWLMMYVGMLFIRSSGHPEEEYDLRDAARALLVAVAHPSFESNNLSSSSELEDTSPTAPFSRRKPTPPRENVEPQLHSTSVHRNGQQFVGLHEGHQPDHELHTTRLPP